MKIPATFAILIVLCLHGEIATQSSNAPKSPEKTADLGTGNVTDSLAKDMNSHNSTIIDKSGPTAPVASQTTNKTAEMPPVISNISSTDSTPNSTKSTIDISKDKDNTTTTTPPPVPTTTTPPPTTTKPTVPPTTQPTKPTSTPPTTQPPTPPPTTTKAPEPTTPNVTSTAVPPTTAAPAVSTPAPHNKNRFDGPSFIGGIVLSLGLVAIGFIGWKYYKARTERNYRTL